MKLFLKILKSAAKNKLSRTLCILILFGPGLIMPLGFEDVMAYSSTLFLPIVSRELTYSVAGQIVDQNFHPAAGIIVKAENGLSTVTGMDGVYVLGGLKVGNHTITPQNSNRYYFDPTFRSVTISADITGVNFSARPSGGEYINNGSFEDNSAWEINATEIPAVYSTRAHHSGLRAMQAGIFESELNSAGFSKFRQMVPIPNKAMLANLTFWTAMGWCLTMWCPTNATTMAPG
jgi:hypothetical protein